MATVVVLGGWAFPSESQAILMAHDITLDGPFPPRVIDALAAGLRSLPPPLRTPPGGPLVLDWDPAPRPYAQDSRDPSHFVVHAFAPSGAARARFRLHALSTSERADLWWRRALVHAIFARWDRARGWSATARWRKVALWDAGGIFSDPARRGTDPWSVSRPAGARSPHLDLVTFAEEAFVPATSVHPGAVVSDARVGCQERSKWGFLFETLAAERLAPYRPHGTCPAFDGWADLPHLESIEVLFVAASASAPESAFGHLMLRPVYGSGARVKSPGFQTVIQIVALTSKADGGAAYLWRGLTGEFPMVVMTTTLASVRREKLELEQRDIHRFRLRLNGRERARLMDRVWDLERTGTFPYHFFSENCATILVWLVDGALDARASLRLPDAPWVMPGAVLDVLSGIEVTRPENQPAPLLSPVAGTLTSTATRARRAYRRRQKLAQKLPAPMAAIHRASLDPDPLVRRRAYEQLPDAVADAGAPRVVYQWLALTARIERYLADRAATALRKAAAKASSKERDPRERLAERRAWLRGDPTRTQHMSALVWQSAPDGRGISETERTFYRYTEIWAGLVRRYWRDADPQAWLEAQARKDRNDEAAWSARAIPRSGAGRHLLGMGIDDGGPALVIGSAGLHTRLGEPLGHGPHPGTAVRIFEGRMWLRPGDDGWPDIVRSELTILGLRTISRDIPPARGGFFGQLGWGTAIRWDRKPERALTNRLAIDGELLWVLDQRLRAAAHNVVGLGLSAQTRFSDTTVVPALAPSLSLTHRTPLGGSLENAFRMRCAYSPALVYQDSSFAFAQEASATIALDLFLGTVAGQVLVLGPTFVADWYPTRANPLAAHAVLRLELL